MVRGRRLGIRGLDDGWLGIGIDREGWGEEDHRYRPMCRCRRLRRGTPSRRGEVSRVRSAGCALAGLLRTHAAATLRWPHARLPRAHRCSAASSPPPPPAALLPLSDLLSPLSRQRGRPPLPICAGGGARPGSLAGRLAPICRSLLPAPHRLHSALPTARPPPPPPHSSPPVAALSPTYSGRSSPISCLLAWGRAIIHRGEEERERVIG